MVATVQPNEVVCKRGKKGKSGKRENGRKANEVASSSPSMIPLFRDGSKEIGFHHEETTDYTNVTDRKRQSMAFLHFPSVLSV